MNRNSHSGSARSSTEDVADALLLLHFSQTEVAPRYNPAVAANTPFSDGQSTKKVAENLETANAARILLNMSLDCNFARDTPGADDEPGRTYSSNVSDADDEGERTDSGDASDSDEDRERVVSDDGSDAEYLPDFTDSGEESE